MSDTALLTLGYLLVSSLYAVYWLSLKARIAKARKQNGK